VIGGVPNEILRTSCWLQGLTGMRRRQGSPACARALAAAAAGTPASGGGPGRSLGTLPSARQLRSGMQMHAHSSVDCQQHVLSCSSLMG
jgi:hypothetical protein